MSIRIIGAAIGHGAQDPESQHAPDSLRSSGLVSRLQEISEQHPGSRFDEISWDTTLYPHFTKKQDQEAPVVSEFCERLQKVVGRVLDDGDFPVVIGGDHSCAVGTWSGVARVLQSRGQNLPGLLWIDAHLDSHTFETSPSLAVHGMPLACLLGHGVRNLVNCGGFPNKVDPAHCAVLGARSWEAGEQELLEYAGVRVFTCQEIKERGLRVCLAEALAIVASTSFWGITVDMDAFDPELCPGVCSPEPHGLNPQEVLALMREYKIAEKPGLACLELVELAPSRDIQTKTQKVLEELATTLLFG